MKFEREDRYLVLKRSDLAAALNKGHMITLGVLCDTVAAHRNSTGKPPLQCVVVESDWPEHDPTWDAIQRRMEGRPTREAELLAEIAELKAERTRWFGKAVERNIEITRLRTVLQKIDEMDVHQPISDQEAEIRRLVAQAVGYQDSSHPLTCQIEGKRIAVYVGFDELAFAAAHHPDFWDGESTEDVPNIKVADVAMFAKEVVRELNREEEDGSTLVTRLLDDAVKNAVEDGCEGVDHG